MILKAKKLIGVEQLGIKEIRSKGWENVVACEPNIKFIINGRDPRDIYISYYQLPKGQKILKEQGIEHLCGIMELEFKATLRLPKGAITGPGGWPPERVLAFFCCRNPFRVGVDIHALSAQESDDSDAAFTGH